MRGMWDTYVHGDLGQGSNIAAKKGDGDEGVLVPGLLQIKLHEAVAHWEPKQSRRPGQRSVAQNAHKGPESSRAGI